VCLIIDDHFNILDRCCHCQTDNRLIMADGTIKHIRIEDLIPDDRNNNKGTQFGQRLVENSISQFGAGRSILIDKNQRIIAGNKMVENAGALGFDEVIVVQTTGRQIVAVQRTDVDLDTKKGREMAIADNATSVADIEFDQEVVEQIAEEFDIDPHDWGIDFEGPEDPEDPEGGSEKKGSMKLIIQSNGGGDLYALMSELEDRGFKCQLIEE